MVNVLTFHSLLLHRVGCEDGLDFSDDGATETLNGNPIIATQDTVHQDTIDSRSMAIDHLQL